jgi:hypothetical protein
MQRSARRGSGEGGDQGDRPADEQQCGGLSVQWTVHISSPHVCNPRSIMRTKSEQEENGMRALASVAPATQDRAMAKKPALRAR